MSFCVTSADLCAVRFSLLESDGSPLYSEVDGSAYNMNPISLQINPTVDTGETVTLRDGCGNLVYSRTDPDTNTGADLVLTLSIYDQETIALLLGAEVVAENGQPGIAIGTTTPDPVEFHAWSKANEIGGGQVASPNSYFHWVWPNVTWSLGNNTLQRDPLQVVLNGTAQSSSTIGVGGFSDIPVFTDPFYQASWTADDIPDPTVAPYNDNSATCGFIDTPAS